MEDRVESIVDKCESNSYCIDYDNENFFIGLANKYKDYEEVDLKGYMKCDKDEFKEFFKSVLVSVAKYDRVNNGNFLSEFLDEVLKEVK